MAGTAFASHAWTVLELGQVLDWIASRAVSELGADRVRTLVPKTAVDLARLELETVEELRRILERDPGWSLGAIPDLREGLSALGIEGSVLEAPSLIAFGELLYTSRVARRDLESSMGPDGRLASRLVLLASEPRLEERLGRCFDDDGRVADSASRELARIRRSLRGRRAQLVGRLESLARSLPERVRVPDGSITVRGGRYCIPIRREGKGTIGGIVHDESSTHQTLFIEPPDAIEAMNEIRELELDEAREVHRVLRGLTEELHPLTDSLAATLDALCELDSLQARARFAISHGGSSPELVEEADGSLRVVRGRHPLLVAGGEEVVPFDIELEANESVLLISGPNAGGKTVLLKSLGLLSLLSQSGVIPPVGAGTRLPFFQSIFGVIGDEQSIEASLSTFSAQMANLEMILREADQHSLVLIDEIGGATDPAEGAALAGAVLQRLANQARLTVVTTHLGSLKALAAETDRVVNASLEFDVDALEPTFRLVRDRPGRSYALEIASRHGLPADVVADARVRLGGEARAIDDLLRDLERTNRELEGLQESARTRSDRLAQTEEEWTERWAELERREAEVEATARDASERYLLNARGLVEDAIARLEERYESTVELEAEKGRGGATREARDAVEKALRASRSQRPREEGPQPPTELGPGMHVRLRGTQKTGRILELRGRRAVIETDGLRLTARDSELEWIESANVSAPSPSGLGADTGAGKSERRPEIPVHMEIDLRGLRAGEIEATLLPALDAAIVADLPWLRIIHGKGGGALRARVGEILAADGRVPDFRIGDPDEGGTGVTIAEFRAD
jgi:DNA mismatch repair protein MutS2